MKSRSALFQNLEAGIRWLAGVHIPQLAANAGYFMVLSVFPALLLVLSGLGYTGLSVEILLDMLCLVFPQAMMDTARRLVSGSQPGLSTRPTPCSGRLLSTASRSASKRSSS